MPQHIKIKCMVSLVLLTGILPSLLHAQHMTGGIDEAAREAWKRDAISFLQTAKPEDFANKIEFYESNRGYDAVMAFAVNQTGCVLLDEDEWVCIVTHSAHDDPKLGDIVLAIDSLGNIYQIDTHVCGGTAYFRGFDMSVPANTVEFFALFKGDKVGRFWEELPQQAIGKSGNNSGLSNPQEPTASTINIPAPKES